MYMFLEISVLNCITTYTNIHQKGPVLKLFDFYIHHYLLFYLVKK